MGFYPWSYSPSSRHSWNPTGLLFRIPARICVGVWPRIDPWTRAGIDLIPHLLIVVRRGHEWKDYLRVWFASSIVSWSLYLALLLFELIIKRKLFGAVVHLSSYCSCYCSRLINQEIVAWGYLLWWILRVWSEYLLADISIAGYVRLTWEFE